MKVIRNWRLPDGFCMFKGQACDPEEDDCSFSDCLYKLAWGLSQAAYQGWAIKEIIDFVKSRKEKK